MVGYIIILHNPFDSNANIGVAERNAQKRRLRLTRRNKLNAALRDDIR